MTLYAGARGPILSLIITFSIYYLLASKKSTQFVLNGFVIVAAMTIMYLILELGDFGVLGRFERLTDYETMLRYERLVIAFGMLQSPSVWLEGLGPDGFNNITGLNYVHNLIIEMVLEYGLLGLVLISIIIGYGLHFSYKLIGGRFPYQYKVFGPVWIYYFLSTMVSSNVIGNRNLFFLTFILVSIQYVLRRSGQLTTHNQIYTNRRVGQVRTQ
jgi:hypothetical protein